MQRCRVRLCCAGWLLDEIKIFQNSSRTGSNKSSVRTDVTASSDFWDFPMGDSIYDSLGEPPMDNNSSTVAGFYRRRVGFLPVGIGAAIFVRQFVVRLALSALALFFNVVKYKIKCKNISIITFDIITKL